MVKYSLRKRQRDFVTSTRTSAKFKRSVVDNIGSWSYCKNSPYDYSMEKSPLFLYSMYASWVFRYMKKLLCKYSRFMRNTQENCGLSNNNLSCCDLMSKPKSEESQLYVV